MTEKNKTKKIKTRIQHKHAIESNWQKAVNFIPLESELIIYDVDETHSSPRFKIGDGITKVNDLPFTRGVGKDSKDNGEIFNDYENNQAISAFTHAEGRENIVGSKGFNIVNKVTLEDQTCAIQADFTEEAIGAIYYSLTNGVDILVTIKLKNGTYDCIGKIKTIIDMTTVAIEQLNYNDEKYKNYESNSSSDKLTLWEHFLNDTIELDNEGNIISGENTNTIIFPQAPQYGTKDYGTCGHVEGKGNQVVADYGHAEGLYNIVGGKYGHAEGNNNLVFHSAHVEGNSNKATGYNSHAEGHNTMAVGLDSHSEGALTLAYGIAAHAEGHHTNAISSYTHTENQNTIAGAKGYNISNSVVNEDGTITITLNTEITEELRNILNEKLQIENKKVTDRILFSSKIAYNFNRIGEVVEIINANSVRVQKLPNEGYYDNEVTKIYPANTEDNWNRFINQLSSIDPNSSTFYFSDYPQYGNVEVGVGSHSEGYGNNALGGWSHAEGAGNISYGRYAHTEGDSNIAYYSAHAEGKYTQALGNDSHSEGYATVAQADYSHAEGRISIASGETSHAEGYNTKAIGKMSHSEGNTTIAEGNYSHSEGLATKAFGNNSHTEGSEAKVNAKGTNGHAEGYATIVDNVSAHAEGHQTQANGPFSHAENQVTKANGQASHAEGIETIAQGYGSHAEGEKTQTIGKASHTEGIGTIANGAAQHVEGKYNSPMGAEYVHIVGQGTSDTNRKNIHTLKNTGDSWYAGKVYVGSDNEELATVNHEHPVVGEEYKMVDTDLLKLGVTAELLDNIDEGFILIKDICEPYNTRIGDSIYRGTTYSINYTGYIEFTVDKITCYDKNVMLPHECEGKLWVDGELKYTWNINNSNEDYTYKGIVNNTIKFSVNVADMYFSSIKIGEPRPGLMTPEHLEKLNSLPGQKIPNGGEIFNNANTATGLHSHAEGNGNRSTGKFSHAEGSETLAANTNAHAEGWSTEALGTTSHAEGHNCVAKGDFSHAEGVDTIANGWGQHVQGKWNKPIGGSIIHIVGNGSGAADNQRSNAHTLDTSGNAWYQGNVYVGGSQQSEGSKLATETYVNTKVANIVESAPETLNTLNELAAALGDDPNFATTVATQIGTKADKTAVEGHISNKENPHEVTAEQVGAYTKEYIDTTVEKLSKLASYSKGEIESLEDRAFIVSGHEDALYYNNSFGTNGTLDEPVVYRIAISGDVDFVAYLSGSPESYISIDGTYQVPHIRTNENGPEEEKFEYSGEVKEYIEISVRYANLYFETFILEETNDGLMAGTQVKELAECGASITELQAKTAALETQIGEISAALAQLHEYAQSLIGGSES